MRCTINKQQVCNQIIKQTSISAYIHIYTCRLMCLHRHSSVTRCVYIYTYTHTCIHRFYAYMPLYMCVFLYIHTHMQAHTHTLSLYIYMQSINIYIYIYTYICTHIHILALPVSSPSHPPIIVIYMCPVAILTQKRDHRHRRQRLYHSDPQDTAAPTNLVNWATDWVTGSDSVHDIDKKKAFPPTRKV